MNDICWNSGTNPVKPLIGALTYIWDDDNGSILEADVVFYDGVQWSWSTDPENDELDIETFALHELGHVLGLGDVTNTTPVMYEKISLGERQRALETDDINGMKAIYGLVLTEPNSSETWNVGSSYDIEWTHVGVIGNVDIVLFRNYPSGKEDIAINTENDGSYPWTPTVPVSDNCRIRVQLHDDNWIFDYSDANFTIAGYDVTYPRGGEVWFIGGADRTITWNYLGVSGYVAIELNRDYPNPNAWETLTYSTPVGQGGSGSWTYHVDGTPSTNCRIKVRNTSPSTNYAISADDFTITTYEMGSNVAEITPNPFNSTTRIRFQIPDETRLSLIIYDIIGRKVAVLENGVFQAGEHEAVWDASNMASGIYFLQMKTGDFQDTKKLLLLK